VGARRYRRFEVRATSHLHRLIFTDPEVAAVGLTATQAELAGYLTPARMVVDEDRQVIIGMTFVGRDVAELLYAATIAFAGEIPLKRLRNTVPAYATMSEIRGCWRGTDVSTSQRPPEGRPSTFRILIDSLLGYGRCHLCARRTADGGSMVGRMAAAASRGTAVAAIAELSGGAINRPPTPELPTHTAPHGQGGTYLQRSRAAVDGLCSYWPLRSASR
jgi:hypothetical protein